MRELSPLFVKNTLPTSLPEIVIEPDAIVKAFFDLPSIFKVSKPLISKLPPPPC